MISLNRNLDLIGNPSLLKALLTKSQTIGNPSPSLATLKVSFILTAQMSLHLQSKAQYRRNLSVRMNSWLLSKN
jgi:hypothetical protein